MPKFYYSALIFILLLVQVVLNPALAIEDWAPQGPPGEKELAIFEPASFSIIPANAPDFVLGIKALIMPHSDWEIGLQWARIEPAKDPSIEKDGHWIMNKPAGVSYVVFWTVTTGSLQTKRFETRLFKPGLYAVRAKLRTSTDDKWTNWKKFWIGKITFDLSKTRSTRIGTSLPGKQTTTRKTPDSGSSTQTKSIGSRVGVDSKGIIVVGGKPAKTRTQFDTNTRSGVVITEKPGSVLPVPPSPNIASTTITSLKKPSLWINTKKVVATTTPQLNKPFGVSIPLVNLGNAVNGNSPTNKITVKATCKALSGGACKTSLSLPVPTIKPGQYKEWGNLHGMFTASKPGKYRISVTITPANKPGNGVNAGYAQSWSKDVTIESATLKSGMPVPGTTKKQINSPTLLK